MVVKKSELGDVPTVSVCVPAYNYGRFIADCIESVLAQTFTEWELIICDDRSTDDTRDICTGFVKQDRRVHYFLNEKQLGMYPNFARTVTYARGTYLKPLCADDWLHPEYLEACLKLMDKYPTAVLVATNCIETDVDGNPLASNYFLPREFFRGKDMIRREIFGLGGIGGNSSFLIRRWAYERAGGYDTSFLYLGDHVLGLKLCLVGDFAYTNSPLFYGRLHESQSSMNDPKKFLDVMDWFRVPDTLFPNSSPFSKNWCFVRLMVGRIGANYTITSLVQIVRGNRSWGIELLRSVFCEAPVRWPILLMIPFRLIARIVRKILWGRRGRRSVPVLVVIKPKGLRSRQLSASESACGPEVVTGAG